MKYIYEINILETEKYSTVYSTRSSGKNKNEAITKFKKEEPEIRKKYADIGGFCIGIKRICKAPFQ